MKLTSILLIVVLLSGCVARDMPDWHRVDALRQGTRVDVEFYKEDTPDIDADKTTGYFVSATDDAVVLSDERLTDKLTSSTYREIQKKRIKKLLAEREFGQRYAGWVVLIASFAFFGQAFNAEADFNPLGQVIFGLGIPLGISIPVFLGTKMGGIYEVPDWVREKESNDDTQR